MADLLALSARIIDQGSNEPNNRITNELSEVADGLAIVESFSHCVALDTGEGLVAFDASHANTGSQVVRALSRGDRTRYPIWSTPMDTLIMSGEALRLRWPMDRHG